MKENGLSKIYSIIFFKVELNQLNEILNQDIFILSYFILPKSFLMPWEIFIQSLYSM